MDTLRGMEIFIEVADSGSFSKGAARLQISTAQASQQVKRIEKRLGVLLVDRSTRHLRLTEEGKAFDTAAREIIKAVEEAEFRIGELGGTPQGRLRVEAPILLVDNFILPVVAAFRERYPNIMLEFVHGGQIYGGTHSMCEVAIRLGPFADTSLVAHTLGSVPMSVFASPEYLKRYGEPQSPVDLAGHHCINFVDSFTGAVHPWHFVRDEEIFSIVPAPGLAFDEGESRRAAALRGLGIYRGLDLGMERYVMSGKLCRILQDWQTDGPPIMISYAGGRILSQRARCFVEHLRTAYAAGLIEA